jgi:hypothetical protein
MGQAARETGLSKTTIWRAVKAGKMSAVKNLDGDYEIDPAELFRVFPHKPSHQSQVMASSSESVSTTPEPTPDWLAVENEGLKKLIETHNAEIVRQEQTITDLRTRLDRAESERRDATNALRGLLTHTSQPKPARGLLWAIGGVLLLTIMATVTYWKMFS